ncbi:DUF6044 family protein [bacterium]|nr:DUF6044 family protein [bacterium]
MFSNMNEHSLDIEKAPESRSYIILALWSFILTCEYFVFGGASVMISADNADQLVPSLLGRSFSGEFNPLWDRFAAAGIDDIAGADHALFNIFLFDVLPAWAAHGLHLGAQSLFGAFAVFALLRRTLKVSQGAAVVGAMTFALTLHPYLVTAVESFTPVLILALAGALDDKSNKYKWAAVVASFFLVTWTGYFSRLIPYASIFVFMWFLVIDTRRKVSDWAIIVTLCALIPVVKIKDIWTLATVAPLSHAPLVRSFTATSEHVSNFFSYPFFFSHHPTDWVAFGLLLASALFMQKKLLVHIRIFALLILSGGLLTVVLTAIQELITPYLPFAAGYRLTYFSGLSNLAFAAAAAYGVHILWAAYKNTSCDNGKMKVVSTTCAFVIFAILAAPMAYSVLKKKHASLYSWVTNGTALRYFDSPVLQDLEVQIKSQPFPERVEGYQIYPAYLNAYGLETAGSYNPIYYRHYYEYWGKLVEAWVLQLPPASFYQQKFTARKETYGGAQSFRGDRLMMYPEEMRAATSIGRLYNLTLLSLANVGYIVSRDRINGPGLRQISDASVPISTLSHRGKVARNLRENFRGATHLFVYRNENVFPRFFSVAGLKVFNNTDNLLDTLAVADHEDIRRHAFTDRSVLPKNVEQDKVYSTFDIKLTAYSSDEIRLNVDTGDIGLLVITNTYSPYWQCRTDTEELSIFPVYHTFWGMEVPKGTRQITCQYLPPYKWIWG